MIAIPNMDKPKSCNECRYKMWTMNETFCNLLDKMLGDEDIRPDCPLIDIVTCGECKYMRKYALRSDEPTGIWCHRRSVPRLVTDDDFCSYGEPRESEYVAKD